jgi:ankyrin repeat protein
MLQNMGNLNPSDKDKATAFHHAAENGHWEICYLIKQK